MSTFEEFESAPVGATATHDDGGRAMKRGNVERRWVLQSGLDMTDKEMERWGYTLDPAPPSTAREALDLAWELAHPVKPGQVIPKGTRYLAFTSPGLREYTACVDREIRPELAPITRTLEPLPDPTPDWLDAPAVLARVDGWSSCADPQVFARHDYHGAPSEWRYNGAESFSWQELRDVTPLYPKETDA